MKLFLEVRLTYVILKAVKASYGAKKEDKAEFFAIWSCGHFNLDNASVHIEAISANSVTLLSFAGLLSLFFQFSEYGLSDYFFFIFLWLVLDHVDGNLARYYKTSSKYGDFSIQLFATLTSPFFQFPFLFR